VRAAGRTSRTRTFLARAATGGAANSRIAVVAPGAIGTAVMRNRARRRVREAFQLAFASARSSPSIDLVVTVRAEAASAPFDAIATDARATLAELAR
jgi:ribonuclease P protein component